MPRLDIAKTMFGLLNLSQYLPVLILAYFGLGSAAKVQEGKVLNINSFSKILTEYQYI